MRKFLLLIFFLQYSLSSFSQVDSTTYPINSDSVVQSDSRVVVDEINNQSRKILGIPGEVSSAASRVGGPPSISEFISFTKIFWALVFLIAGYLIIRVTNRALELLAERSTKYRIAVKSLIPIVKILGWVVLIFIVVAGIFQPPAATLLAFSASIGVAVGFASQDILKNIFGGIMILFDRPFQSGDKIEVGSYYGEVIEIGLRSTRIVTPDDSVVSIPNSEIMNSSVSNTNYGETNCQVVAEIYLPVDVDTIKARSIGIQVAQVSKYVFLNKPISVIFSNEYKDRKSLLKMKIKAYVFDIRDEFKFKSDMTEIAINKLLEAGLLKPDAHAG